jgi:hypothetical protein
MKKGKLVVKMSKLVQFHAQHVNDIQLGAGGIKQADHFNIEISFLVQFWV